MSDQKQELIISSKQGGGYWTGARWDRSQSNAKTFQSWDDANAEMTNAEIEWTWKASPKKK